MRTIDRLRYEFGVPLEYDESHRGYYVTRKEFSLALLPPSRDELIALFILSELAVVMDDAALQGAVAGLCSRMTFGRADVEHKMEKIKSCFSCDVGIVARWGAFDVFWLLEMCSRQQLVKARYRSPWVSGEAIDYVGVFERIHLANGFVHALFRTVHDRSFVLNLSFVVEIKEIYDIPDGYKASDTVPHVEEEWFSGQGRWSGDPGEIVEVVLSAPASRFFGSQMWHQEQHDTWDGETLTRRFPARISAELAGRLLSLGRSVISLKPQALLDRIRGDVRNFARLCG